MLVVQQAVARNECSSIKSGETRVRPMSHHPRRSNECIESQHASPTSRTLSSPNSQHSRNAINLHSSMSHAACIHTHFTRYVQATGTPPPGTALISVNLSAITPAERAFNGARACVRYLVETAQSMFKTGCSKRENYAVTLINTLAQSMGSGLSLTSYPTLYQLCP